MTPLHPTLHHASRHDLPPWGTVGPDRRAHMKRVSELMDRWAGALGIDGEDRARWRAAGFLHDALRDASPDEIRSPLPEEFRTLPDPVLHGPAVAERLHGEGVDDDALLRAVAFHTVGHPALDLMGRALYCADHLEPGRRGRDEWRRSRRERFPDDPAAVTLDVLRERIEGILERGRPLREETVGFWNVVASEVDGGEA